MSERTCSRADCTNLHNAHGLCLKHYKRLRKRGTADDPVRLSVEELYRAKVDVKGPDDCWPWLAATDGDGYGRFNLRGRRGQAAHRVGWLLTNGPIPQGMLICHSCDNPPCQNPGHWFLGTAADNNADRSAKGRSRGAQQTACSRGHPFVGHNLIVRPDGTRYCRTCHNDRRRVVALPSEVLMAPLLAKGYDTWPDVGPADFAHLVLTCKALQNRKAPVRELLGLQDVNGTDICGWCRRVWLARHRKELSAP